MVCNNCGHQNADANAFCELCGAPIGAGAPTPPPPGVPPMAPPPPPGAGYAPVPPMVVDPYDHTAEFDPKDISDNKVYAMVIYLMGAIGIVIALLASGDSPYLKFHLRQAIKISVCEILVSLATVLLCWTFIVPIAGGVAVVILSILRIIAFFQICKGKAVEPAIVKKLNFLK